MLCEPCRLQQMFYIGSLYYIMSTRPCNSDKECSLHESGHKFPLQFSIFWDRKSESKLKQYLLCDCWV